MSDNSKIEWTDATWNPVRGCVKISPGCKHCYAETFAERFRGVANHPYEHGFDLRLIPGKLAEPLDWPSQRVVFVNSMSDLFQDGVPDEYVVAVAKVMALTPWHTYQVLTKRAERMRAMLDTKLRFAGRLGHIWWGVSVEDRKHGLPRVGQLREANARVRFLSIEPLLEGLGEFDLHEIHWAIVGGESGPGARRMDPEWVEEVKRACLRAAVPFFFKQWGGVQKTRAGRELHGRTFDEMPARAVVAVPDRAERRELAQTVGSWAREFDDRVVVSSARLARRRAPASVAG